MKKLINPNLLPNSITEQDLDKMLFNIDTFFMNNVDRKDHLHIREYHKDDVIIELSNKEPIRYYQGKSIDEIKDEIIKHLKKDKDHDKHKSDILESSIDSLWERRQIIAGWLDDLDYKDLTDLLRNHSFEGIVLGAYDYDCDWKTDNESFVKDRRIILYVKNINKQQNQYGGLNNIYNAVLSHEYFHWLHHLYTMKSSALYRKDPNATINYVTTNFKYPFEFEQRHDYVSEVIKESFAAYFAYMYCKNKGINVSSLYDAWDRHSVVVYPYSGAKYMLDDGKDLEEGLYLCFAFKMNCVLERMLRNQKLYYRILNKEYELLKNSITNISLDDYCEICLKRMGKGWFILKFAEDNGINTGTSTTYGNSQAMYTRTNNYNNTIAYHKQMIRYLSNNWNTRISGGDPILDSNDLRNILELIRTNLNIN